MYVVCVHVHLSVTHIEQDYVEVDKESNTSHYMLPPLPWNSLQMTSLNTSKSGQSTNQDNSPISRTSNQPGHFLFSGTPIGEVPGFYTGEMGISPLA